MTRGPDLDEPERAGEVWAGFAALFYAIGLVVFIAGELNHDRSVVLAAFCVALAGGVAHLRAVSRT